MEKPVFSYHKCNFTAISVITRQIYIYKHLRFQSLEVHKAPEVIVLCNMLVELKNWHKVGYSVINHEVCYILVKSRSKRKKVSI